mgnify:CR=1 FL=1
MRMLGAENGPLEHEWLHGCDHELFQSLELLPYSRNDVEIWTTYQGFWKMNDVASDSQMSIRQVPIEDVIANRDLFQEIVSFISHDRISYSEELLDLLYGWVWTPFRGEEVIDARPDKLRYSWPDWKVDAFDKLVSPDARESFEALGHCL